jgi:hypothetical protein
MLKRMCLLLLLCVTPLASGPAEAEAGGNIYNVEVTVRADHQADCLGRAEGGPGQNLPINTSTYPPQKRIWGTAMINELPNGMYTLSYEVSYRQEDGRVDLFKGGLPAAISTNYISIDNGQARLMIRVNRG